MKRLIQFPTMSDRVASGLKSEDFRVYHQRSGEALELFIHGVVGDEWDQTDSASVAKLLRDNRDRRVNVRVNSAGGLAYDGIAIYNALAQHPQHVTATIEAMAGSAASLLVMAADEIVMHESASLFIHHPWGIGIGRGDVLRDIASDLDRLSDQTAAVYAARSGQSVEDVRNLMDGVVDGTVLSAAESVDRGFADRVIANKKREDRREAPDDGEQVAAYKRDHPEKEAIRRAKQAEAVRVRQRLVAIDESFAK